MADQHCQLVVKRGRVTLHPVNGECYINRGHVTNPSRLRQGTAFILSSFSLHVCLWQEIWCSWVALLCFDSTTHRRPEGYAGDTVAGFASFGKSHRTDWWLCLSLSPGGPAGPPSSSQAALAEERESPECLPPTATSTNSECDGAPVTGYHFSLRAHSPCFLLHLIWVSTSV